ncbi:unnamed protein product [Symbiodinium sp. CCMP2592]|nr:unnamed protein product [Symbiodinium sp. CCMP2592]
MEINIQIKNAQPEDLLQDTEQSAVGSGAKAKRKAQPFSAFRKHEGRTMRSPAYAKAVIFVGIARATTGAITNNGKHKTRQTAAGQKESHGLQISKTESLTKDNIQIVRSQDNIQISFPQDNAEIQGIGQFKVNWKDIEIPQFPIHDSTKQYVDALCAAAEFRIDQGVLLEHDLTWDRGGDPTPETMRRFYFLQSSDLTLQNPPLPTRQEKILFWSHATDVGALFNMLKERNMRPMNAHGVAAFGCNIFYALGHEMSGSDIDEHNLTRVIFNTTRSAKNLAGIVVGGRAWGSLRKHLGGSYETARAATEEDEVLKDANAKAYCVSRNRYCFTCIAFEQLMTPPSTANTLISQYQRAAGITPQGSIEYAVVGVRQRERIEHTNSGTLASDNTVAVVATYASARIQPGYATFAAAAATVQHTAGASQCNKYTDDIGNHGLAGMDVRDVTVAHFCRHGMEEFGLRGLSHGKFTGMILTRNIAESVLLSQLQKKLRENNIDVDATIDAIHQSKGQKAPDKVKEAITFVAPLVDTIMDAIKPWAQVRNYGAKNTEGDNQAAQRMQVLEEQTAKYKQRLRSAGIDVTPQKSLPLQNEPNEGPEATAAPPKRRRLTKGAIKQRNEDILAEPHNVIRASGQEPPTSMTSIATWITNLKKSLPRDKHAEVDNHIQSVQTILEGAKYTKAELQEMATRWGLPMSLTTAPKASPKNLQQLIAAVTYLAVLNKQTYATATRDASFCYIGSTNITVAKREYNRVAKLRQLQQLKLPKIEIAIRYWNDSQTYQHYSTILLSQHSEYIDAWAEEHSLIQRWQPKLNYPFVTKELVKKAQFWKLLYAISSDTKQEFEASKELRSGKHEATHPSLERALWNHKRKVTDMGRHWKPTECQCAQFIKQHPRAQVHEGHVVTGLETLQLHSTNQIFQNIGAGNAFYSSKKRIKKQHQEQFQRWLKHHQFPRDQRILDDFDDFFEQEWKQHRLQLQREPRLTHRLAKNILGMIPDDYIVHNEDHANAHLMIYCPNIYNQAAYNTWMDKQTFRMLDADPAEIKQAMKNNTPKIVAKHYAKLLDYEKPLPYGYILMKRKKRWAKGRTIIAYSNTCIGKLLKIAALALHQMLRITWPNHFGDVSSPQLWEEIHQLFYNNEHLYPERHLKFLNHDLVGFFNSIPQSDILQSIQFLTSQFLDEHNATITVDPYNKIAPAHSGRSTHSLKSNMVKMQAEHIPAIIQFSFDACAFTAIGEVFQQTCGTSMGNQISPILSTCAIVATEITWLRMYGQFVSSAHLHDKFWIRRYVDNRAIIVDEDELQHNPFIQQLASLHFYKKPVQLEDEACDDFLGLRIHADNRKITYNLHREPWRYRLPQSAGTTKLRLSGYHSRKHLIRTIAYPEDVAQRQIQELDDLYGDLGYARLLKTQQSQRPDTYGLKKTTDLTYPQMDNIAVTTLKSNYRLIISAYTTNRIEDICREDKRYLRMLGFNLP